MRLRPVVRPGRSIGRGAASAPVLPTPEAMVVGPLLEQRGHDTATVVPRRPRPRPRLRALLAAAAALAVLLTTVLVLVLTRGDIAPGGSVVEPPGAAAVQRTVLVAVTGDQSRVAAAALLAVGDDAVDQVLLPEDLLLTVADAGPGVPLSQTVVLGEGSLERGVEDTLGVRVDASLLLSGDELVELVDSVGGVVLDVQEQIGTTVAAGPDQRLAGAQALTYATTEVPGEPLEARLSRVGQVLSTLLAALPSDAAGVDAALTTAGATTDAVPGSVDDPVASPQELVSQTLADAAVLAQAGDVVQVILPTQELSGGQDGILRGLDDAGARTELDARLPGALLPQSELGEVQVVLSNGDGRQGLVAAARDRLVAAGLRYSGGGNAQSFDAETTSVLVPRDTPEDRARGEAVLEALDVGSAELGVSPLEGLDTDVVVILGTDFADTVPAQTP